MIPCAGTAGEGWNEAPVFLNKMINRNANNNALHKNENDETFKNQPLPGGFTHEKWRLYASAGTWLALVVER